MSDEFFRGLKQGLELGARFKYLQINLLTLMRDFEKLHQKTKQHYLYDLWSKVIECQSNIEELLYEGEHGETTRVEMLNNYMCQFNDFRQKYRVLLEDYNNIKKTRPVRKRRKVVTVKTTEPEPPPVEDDEEF
jgi:hypothetical protein